MADKGIEQSERPQQPLGKLDLSLVSQYLAEYNKQFGMGGMMASVFLSYVHQDDETYEKIKSIDKMSLDNLRDKIDPILSATGLSLQPVETGKMFGPTGEQESTAMKLNLSNGSKFVAYLEALEGNATQSQLLGIEDIPQILVQQLTSQYDLSDPNDERVLEFFGSAQKIINSYKKLGLSEEVKELSTYLDIARQGYLREFLAARKAQVLEKPGAKTFGPSMWHTDTSEEGYIKSWDKTLEAIELIGKNPKAKQLYESAIQNLMACIVYAKNDLEKIKKEKPEYYGPKSSEIFTTLKVLLNQYSERLLDKKALKET